LAWVSNALDIKGDFIQGGLLFGKTDLDDILFYNSKKVPIDETGEFLIGLGRKHPIFGELKVIKPTSETIIKKIEIKQREYKIQKINNLEKSKVTPPEKFYKRIKEEGFKIKKAKSFEVKKSYYHAGFEMPAQGIITGVYGSQRILNGIPKRPHYGIDIANKIGTPILSPSDGVIVLVEKNLYFSGGTIIISHGRGFTSSLLHLKDILVEEQSIIKKGEVIGLMGDTGRATGSHLDWRMEIRGVRVDPYLLVEK
jgi:murein DD-endopeptidase MepM/ murein hydrolase activator NlpD